MTVDKTWLRSFILAIVKPLKSGKIVDQSGQNAGMDNLYPDGGVNNSFRFASPFGLITKVPKGVTGFYQSLFGSSFEQIILGLLHAKRPEPTGVGETVLYSTTEAGDVIKVKISLKNDGTLVIDAPTKVQVICDNIELGAGALEKVLNGETFQTRFNGHQHYGNLGAPTSTPIVQSPAGDLSNVVKAKK